MEDAVACGFMEKDTKLNPHCKACDTWVIFCRNKKSPVFGAKMTSRTCTRLKCRCYTKEVPDDSRC